ncbi:MAG: hypothetical protein GY724_15705 [Actinomycetia bacterium]|nr:hypothetical protein [Actinomycetes bacterium]
MPSGIYLEDHPPARTQFRTTRRAAVTGAIVVHTAENTTDTSLPDGGAEGVARFISIRTDAAGSYHTVVDSDSVVDVGRYEWEMFHEGTGGNRWSLGLAFACEAAEWPNLPETWVGPALRNAALEAATMAAWVKSTVGVTVPAKRITATQYRNGEPGFIGHGDLDPGRRSDPGAEFPWNRFLDQYVLYAGGDLPMADWCVPGNRKAVIEGSQQLLADEGLYTGPIDADWYTGSNAALVALRDDRNQMRSERDTAATARDTAVGERDVAIAARDAAITERDALQVSLDDANNVNTENATLIAQLEARITELEQLDPEASQRLAAARGHFIDFGTALGLKIEPLDPSG